MAEAFAKAIHPNLFEYYSAGTTKHGMNARAVLVMQELGIDMSTHYSKTSSELADQLNNEVFNYVITVCDNAYENCPYMAGEIIIHQSFQDPPRLSAEMINEEEILNVYRMVRDEIKIYIENLPIYLTSDLSF